MTRVLSVVSFYMTAQLLVSVCEAGIWKDCKGATGYLINDSWRDVELEVEDVCVRKWDSISCIRASIERRCEARAARFDGGMDECVEKLSNQVCCNRRTRCMQLFGGEETCPGFEDYDECLAECGGSSRKQCRQGCREEREDKEERKLCRQDCNECRQQCYRCLKCQVGQELCVG